VGTTVSVRELFKRIPVRHREFLRNAKAQVSTTLRLIQAYAIAQPAIRFHVLAERMRGHGAGRSTLLSSSGTARGWGQAAAAVLGDAALSDVEPFELHSESTGWSVSGLLSKASGGRRSRDMQLFFVNRRPIDPPKRVGKLINDTFHQYNTRNWPVVILSFSASQGLVDVNVTPDKRTVFLHNEESLLTALQEELTKFYAPSDTGSNSVSVLADFGIKSLSSSSSGGSRGPSLIAAAAATLDQHAADSGSRAAGSQSLEQFASTPTQSLGVSPDAPATAATSELDTSGTAGTMQAERPGVMSEEAQGITNAAHANGLEELPFSDTSVGRQNSGDAPELDFRTVELQPATPAAPRPQFKSSEVSLRTTHLTSTSDDDDIELHVVELDKLEDSVAPQLSAEPMVTQLTLNDEADGEEMMVTHLTFDAGTGEEAQPGQAPEPTPRQEVPNEPQPMQLVAAGAATDLQTDAGDALVPADAGGAEDLGSAGALVATGSGASGGAPSGVGTVRASVSMSQLQAAISRRRQRAAAKTQQSASEPCVQFPTAFSLSSLRSGAEGRASLEEVATFGSENAVDSPNTSTRPADGSQLKFDKGCFAKMRVIGQFNLGFIIAALRTQTRQSEGESGKVSEHSGLQLFIIDQHASDEKFRFEGLNIDSKIDRQPLVSPHFMQLTPAQEQLAESHLEIFRLNGFEIRRDDSRPPGRRMRLSTLPTCQGLVFNERDVHDLLYTLEEAESHQSRPNAKDASAGSGLLDLTGHRALWSSTAVPRPKKVWALLACRACRGAVMIGKALRINEMERIVRNLGSLQQPWNCPHGRPTMRHLIDAGAAWKTPQRKPVLTEILKSLQVIAEPLPLMM